MSSLQNNKLCFNDTQNVPQHKSPIIFYEKKSDEKNQLLLK